MSGNNPLRDTFSGNRVRRKLESDDGVAVGAGLKIHSPMLVELFGDVGLDFAFVDTEHNAGSPWNSTNWESLQRAADISGIDLIARIPESNPAMVRKVLDSGVRNVIIPRVKTPQEVRRVVEAGRFDYGGQPGERGIGGARANMWESFTDDEDYLKREDDSTLVGVIIETKEAVENLEEIIAIDELGFVLLGHVDLAISLGYSFEPDVDIRYPHDFPELRRIETELEQLCKENEVPFGVVPRDIDYAKEAVNRGHQLFLVGLEMDAIRAEFTKWGEELSR